MHESASGISKSQWWGRLSRIRVKWKRYICYCDENYVNIRMWDSINRMWNKSGFLVWMLRVYRMGEILKKAASWKRREKHGWEFLNKKNTSNDWKEGDKWGISAHNMENESLIIIEHRSAKLLNRKVIFYKEKYIGEISQS